MAIRITILSAIGNLSLDCTSDFSHNLPVTVTKHPIEDGTSISDHVINENMTFSVTGVVVDNKIADFNHSMTMEQAFSFLENLRTQRITVSLLTYNRKYSNLVISGLSFPKSLAEKVLNVQIDLEQIRVVSSTFTTTPVASSITEGNQDKATGEKEAGVNPGEASAVVKEERLRSIEAEVEIIESDSNLSAAQKDAKKAILEKEHETLTKALQSKYAGKS